MTLHRVGKAISVVLALFVAAACFVRPVLLAGIGLLVVVIVVGRLVYPWRDRFIPNLYARDTAVYDDAYRAFIGRRFQGK